MKSIGLLLKVLWSPGEAMSLLSRNPRVLVPFVFLAVSSLITGGLVMSKIPASELAMRAIERSPQAANMSDEAKEQLRRRVNSPVTSVFAIVSTVLGPMIVVLLVSAIYFGVFTMIGREGGFKAFLSITAFAFVPGIFRQLAPAGYLESFWFMLCSGFCWLHYEVLNDQ